MTKGKILTSEEIEEIGYDFGLLTRIQIETKLGEK